jgi:glycosyltransferase involved in cell wall biosynthesis
MATTSDQHDAIPNPLAGKTSARNKAGQSSDTSMQKHVQNLADSEGTLAKANRAFRRREYMAAMSAYREIARQKLPAISYLSSLRLLASRMSRELEYTKDTNSSVETCHQEVKSLIKSVEDTLFTQIRLAIRDGDGAEAFRLLKTNFRIWKGFNNAGNLLRVSQYYFQVDAFIEAEEALAKAEAMDKDNLLILEEKATQGYYHLYSSWLMDRTENEVPSTHDSHRIQSWEKQCEIFDTLRHKEAHISLRAHVQACLILSDEYRSNEELLSSSDETLEKAIKLIKPLSTEVELNLAIINARNIILSGTELKQNELEYIDTRINDLDCSIFSIEEWMALCDILNWAGLFLCALTAREKGLGEALKKGSKPIATDNELIVAFNAAIDLYRKSEAEQILSKLTERRESSPAIRELKSCWHLLNGESIKAQSTWPHPITQAEAELRSFLSGKTVALVGPSPDGISDGKNIDSHDIVVRMNWRGQDYSDCSECFGTRTDISIYNAHTIRLLYSHQKAALLERLKYCLIRRPTFELNRKESCNTRFCYVKDFPASFYKSLNGAQAAIAYLLLHGAKRVSTFKIDFYSGNEQHHKDYRGNVESKGQNHLLSALKPVIANHDLVGQIRLYYALLNGIEKVGMRAIDARTVFDRLKAHMTTNNATEVKYIDKPKRDFTQHPLVKAKLLKSYCRGSKHFWYTNYATDSFNRTELPKSLSAFQRKKVLFIAHNFTLSTGVARPISHFLNVVPSRMPNALFESIEFRDKIDVSAYSDEIKKYDYVIVNSLGAFVQNPSLLALLRDNALSKTSVYLHETQWTFNGLLERDPTLYHEIVQLLASTNILCVSNSQKRYLESLGIRAIHVVNNTTVLPQDPWKYRLRKQFNNDTKLIVMVGTLQARKGVQLFSEVADLAKANNLNYHFAWAGSTTKERVVRSPNVEWLGSLDSYALQSLLSSSDVFFLSSLDDPFPLSVIESLFLDIPAVAFAKTGAAEILQGQFGNVGEIYSEHTPEAALTAITNVLNQCHKRSAFEAAAMNFSLWNFIDRFAQAVVENKGLGVLQTNHPNVPAKLRNRAKPVLLLCNGPSFSQAKISKNDITGSIVVRMNHFYLEEHPFADGRIDYFFWAVNEAPLHDNLAIQLANGKYRISTFMSPVPYSDLKFSNRSDATLIDQSRFFDHWLLTSSRDPVVARCMISRPLPTTGLQALACMLALGHRDFIVAGMDFYSNASTRYHYDVPDSLRERMDPKHFQPGYEKGAHSADADLKFLDLLINRYPTMKIKMASEMPELAKLLMNYPTITWD